jgi:hypothetical protein
MAVSAGIKDDHCMDIGEGNRRVNVLVFSHWLQLEWNQEKREDIVVDLNFLMWSHS